MAESIDEMTKEKIHVFDYVKQPPSLLKRFIKRIKTLPFPPPYITNFIGNVLGYIVAIASLGILLPIIFKIRDISYEIDQEDEANQFYKTIAYKMSTGEVIPPPDTPIELKSDTIGFNHINDYVIDNGIIWCRRRQGFTGTEDKPGVWKPLYFDQGADGLRPESLTVDGANLNVMDQNKDVHYRKVLLEARGRVEDKPKQFQMDNPEIKSQLPPRFPLTDDYIAIDISGKVDWSPVWYNFPVVSRIVNFFTGYRLKAQGQLANSHRGRYNDAYLDANNNKHETSVGVTTAFELEASGMEMIKHDPWAPMWSKIRLYFPESEEKYCVIKKIDPSASCIMAVGHEVNRSTGKCELIIMTNLCDIDILGGNPILKYAYQTELSNQGIDGKAPQKKVRILPDKVSNEGWVKHTIPGDANTVIYNQPTVIQKRYDDRVLRIGAKHNDQLGFFEKDLNPESEWVFKPYALVETKSPLAKVAVMSDTGLAKDKKPPRGFQGLFKNAKVKVEHFGERAYHSTVTVDIEGKNYDCALHRRWGLKTFFGVKGDYYELVVPKETKLDPTAQRFFGGKRVLPVEVDIIESEHQESIRIKPK